MKTQTKKQMTCEWLSDAPDFNDRVPSGEARIGDDSYSVSLVGHDKWGNETWILRKSGQSALYYVPVSRKHGMVDPLSCSCPGHRHRGQCKHCEAMVPLIDEAQRIYDNF